jgi:hypothetical protein
MRPNQPREQQPHCPLTYIRHSHTLTPSPQTVKTLATADVETGLKLREGQPLGEDVSKLISRRGMEDTNVPDCKAFADKVKINLNMLGTLVLNRVDGGVDGARGGVNRGPTYNATKKA